jgi:hypothetical protein
MSYNDWVAACAETNYAGGAAGAAYAKAALTDPNITAGYLPIPKGDVGLPFCGKEEVNIKAPGYALLASKGLIKGIEYNEPTMEFYWQLATLFDKAVETTIGALPKSIAIHYLKDTMSIDAWGVFMEDWEWSGKAGDKNQDFCSEKIKLLFYDIDLTASVLTKVAYSTSAVKTFADCTFTLETVAQNVREATVKVHHTFEPGFVAGEHTRKVPYLKSRTYSGTMTIYTSALMPTFAGYMNDRTTITLIDMVYTLGVLTLTIANAKIKKLDLFTIPDATEETCMYIYTLEWEQGEGFTCVKS